jgi:hypothetical protein
MVVLAFEIYADFTGVALSFGAYVGFAVDQPLPDHFEGTNFVKGIINVIPGVTSAFGPVSIPVNVGTGQHYVILGIDVPWGFAAAAYRLRLSGLGVTVDRTFGVFDPKQYVYIAFEVDKNGATRVIGTGTIAPGGSPIATPGGGSIIPGDIGVAMAETMGVMLQAMLPIVMFNMMMQMMVGMIQGMAGMFGGVIR